MTKSLFSSPAKRRRIDRNIKHNIFIQIYSLIVFLLLTKGALSAKTPFVVLGKYVSIKEAPEKQFDTKMRTFLTAFSLSAVIFVTGCGSQGLSVNYVEGTVTFDGKPLDKATVYFYPQGGENPIPAVGMTDAAGKYQLTSMQGGAVGKGATLGEYTVAVTRLQDEPSRTERIPATTPGEPDEVMTFYDSLIPEKYTTKQTSPLTYNVVSGKNRFDITLDKE